MQKTDKVDVRITETTIEIFYHHNRIASHRRLHGRSGPILHGNGTYAARSSEISGMERLTVSADGQIQLESTQGRWLMQS